MPESSSADQLELLEALLVEVRNLSSAVQQLGSSQVFTDRTGRYVKHYDPSGMGVRIERLP